MRAAHLSIECACGAEGIGERGVEGRLEIPGPFTIRTYFAESFLLGLPVASDDLLLLRAWRCVLTFHGECGGAVFSRSDSYTALKGGVFSAKCDSAQGEREYDGAFRHKKKKNKKHS